ncbi:PREDICTED: putative vomeronasal receptor-like protein 4 [Galeopterus variegatus]|uniref:Vomeronasal type-1 receptor n=1 Tax=Galeopterus variegatus TaxID=482537 RepID=A0ABM0SFH1_GALVR|nr:PREDICTED: putative vomeronasal receptor-like protein 4 [Galeopterus variegatus]
MLSIKNAFIFQAGIGVSANTFLLLLHIFTLLQHRRPKPTDLVTCHLAFVHIVLLLTVVDVSPVDVFESLNFGNDFKCKALFYTSKVMRGLSICSTCLLSVLQAVTISPSTSWLARFKRRLTKYIIHIFLFFWFLNLSVSSNLIFTVVSFNVTQTNLLKVSRHCSLSPRSFILRCVTFTLSTSRDVSCVGIMLLSSAYMVTVLCKHRKRSRHLHSPGLTPATSPEKRATQTILLLVGFFVDLLSMYFMDLITSFISTLLWTYDPVIMSVQKFVFNAHATAIPLVQISSDKRIIDILQNMQSQFHQFLMLVM